MHKVCSDTFCWQRTSTPHEELQEFKDTVWGCIASPQTSFGVRLSHIPFSLRGVGMNVWRMNPKDVCGEARRGYRTVWLYSKWLCLSWATIIINYMYSHIYLCLWIDKQPVRECTVQILNFLKAFFWSSLTHISQLRCLHYFGRFVSIPHTFGAHAVNLWQVYTNWYLQAILFSPSSTHSVCLFVCFTVP